MKTNLREIFENSKMSGHALFSRAAAENRLVFGKNMRDCTTFRAGGPADVFVMPRTEAELADFAAVFLSLDIPVFVLGGGSNVLFPDEGFPGAVLSTVLLDAAVPERTEDGRIFLRCACGCPMDKAVETAVAAGFAGLERFAGLPGTTGGAAFMNARCYERSVSDIFFCADVLHVSPGGGVCAGGAESPGNTESRTEKIFFTDGEWAYKKSPFHTPPDGTCGGRVFGRFSPGSPSLSVLCAVVFALQAGVRSELEAVARQCRQDREKKGHFRLPSAGSVFKNNRAFGKPSGVLIDEAGLRGLTRGGAMVAPWHGNIIVNTGNATAADIRGLMEEVAETVLRRTGFRLEPEIIFAGGEGGV